MVPENIHTHPVDGYWKFQGGRGLKKSMKLNWNFERGAGGGGGGGSK